MLYAPFCPQDSRKQFRLLDQARRPSRRPPQVNRRVLGQGFCERHFGGRPPLRSAELTQRHTILLRMEYGPSRSPMSDLSHGYRLWRLARHPIAFCVALIFLSRRESPTAFAAFASMSRASQAVAATPARIICQTSFIIPVSATLPGPCCDI